MSYLTGAIYPTHGETVLNAPLETAVEAYQAGASAVALGYISPTDTELAHLQSIFKLHELAVEDSMLGHDDCGREEQRKFRAAANDSAENIHN